MEGPAFSFKDETMRGTEKDTLRTGLASLTHLTSAGLPRSNQREHKMPTSSFLSTRRVITQYYANPLIEILQSRGVYLDAV